MNLRSRKGRATLADRYPTYVRISQKSPENNDASQEPPELEEAVSSSINPLQLSSPLAPVFAIRFPVEIWTMILSYFPLNHPFSSTETALCSLAMNMANYRAPPCEGRCIMLRSLSMTCKALRAVMLPLLWEEVDICARHASSAHVPFRECMAYVLREHSLGLLRTPTVAIYVRQVVPTLGGLCSNICIYSQDLHCISSATFWHPVPPAVREVPRCSTESATSTDLGKLTNAAYSGICISSKTVPPSKRAYPPGGRLYHAPSLPTNHRTSCEPLLVGPHLYVNLGPQS